MPMFLIKWIQKIGVWFELLNVVPLMRGHLCRDTFGLAPRCPLIRGTTVYSKIWAPPHKRVQNGLVPAHVLIPGYHRITGVCHRLYPPGEKNWACPKLSLGLANVPPITQRPTVWLTVFHCPHKIYHMVKFIVTWCRLSLLHDLPGWPWNSTGWRFLTCPSIIYMNDARACQKSVNPCYFKATRGNCMTMWQLHRTG